MLRAAEEFGSEPNTSRYLLTMLLPIYESQSRANDAQLCATPLSTVG